MSFKDCFKGFRATYNTRESGKSLLLPNVTPETARKSFFNYFNGSKCF